MSGTQSVPFGYSFDENAPGGLVRIPLPPAYRQLFPGTVAPGATLPLGAGGDPGGIVPLSDPVPIVEGPTVRVTPGASPGGGPSIPGGYTTANPPSTPGWFYNSETGRFEYNPGGGAPPQLTAPDASGNQVPGLGGPLNKAIAAAPKLSWIEELAIRLALALVGLVLVYAGITTAYRRGANATTPQQLFVKVVKGK